jgi:hypothetical protein
MRSVRPTFFRSAARGLHVPAKLTPEPAEHEGLQPRANERPRVGCCEELAGVNSDHCSAKAWYHTSPQSSDSAADFGSGTKPWASRLPSNWITSTSSQHLMEFGMFTRSVPGATVTLRSRASCARRRLLSPGRIKVVSSAHPSIVSGTLPMKVTSAGGIIIGLCSIEKGGVLYVRPHGNLARRPVTEIAAAATVPEVDPEFDATRNR